MIKEILMQATIDHVQVCLHLQINSPVILCLIGKPVETWYINNSMV